MFKMVEKPKIGINNVLRRLLNNVFDYYYYVSTTYLTILRLIKQPKNGINNVFDYYYYVSTTYLTILRLIKQHDWTTSTSLCLLHYVCTRIYPLYSIKR